jgi:hypothetical protein
MKTYTKYLPILLLIASLLPILACEDKSPTGSRAATVFTWDNVMDDPPYFHSVQTDVPPLAVEQDGTVWIAGYLGTVGNSHRCMARRRPGGDWEMWADSGTPGDYYAYDVGVQPGVGGVYVTIVGNPTLEQSGLYQFIDNPPDFQGFQLIYAHPDPGPVAFNDGTGIMFTRHMNNGNSGYYNLNDSTFHNVTLPYITGDVICAAIEPMAFVALAITSDGYILRLWSDQLTVQQFPGTMYSVSDDIGFALCTNQGLYTSDLGDVWVKDETFPGDKAYSLSLGGHEMILGEKGGERKVYKLVGGSATYTEETLNYPVGVGRIKMRPAYGGDAYEGYIYDGETLGERVAH